MQPNSPEMGHLLLGVLSPGERKLEGKSFYLDTLKSRLAAMLMEAISTLGGTVEGFLNKDVSCVVTCSPEGLGDARAKAPCPQPGSGLGDVRAKAPCPQPGSALRDRRTEAPPRGGPGFRDVRADAPRGREGLVGGRAEVCGPRGGSDGMGGKEMGSARLTKQREGVPAKNSTPRPQMEQVYGSRGKALLEKAMRNNERLHGSSVLANARSWGVKIVHVDDFLSYVEMLKAENSKVKSRRPEQRNTNKCQATRVVKAVALKSPYLKVEDSCRKYRPLQMQSMTFPTLFYSGRRSSPFEPLPPPQPERIKDKKHNKAREMLKEPNTSQEKPQSPLLRVPSPCRARKKNLGYCECCQEPFQDQEEHLRSEQHRGFVRDSSHYSTVDQLVASMQPGFHPDPPAQRSPTLMRVPSPQALAPPSPPDLEHHTHSEAEHAVHILLTQGPPPGVLSASPAPLSTTGPAAAPGPANLPLYTQRLYPRPPDTPPSAPHSQPPVLSPENLEPVDFHQPYSDPPVLSPQAPLPPPTEPEDAETGSPAPVTASSEADLIHRAAPEAPVQLPAPLGPSAGLDHVVMAMGPNQASPLLGHGALSCGRSSSLPLPSSSTQNPRKRSRSASPAPDPNNNNNNKRRRTSLIKHQRSEPSSGRTGQEAKTLTLFPRTECDPLLAKASRHPVDTCGTAVHRPTEEEWVFRNRCPAVTAQTQETSYGNAVADGRSRSNSGAVNERCISTGDKTTRSFSREVLLGGAEPLHLATFPLPRAASSPSGKRTACHGSLTGAGERSGPAAPPHASRVTPPPPSPSPRERPHRPPPASRQDSHPSQSFSFSSSVCIESALVPDLAALSPSRSSSEWDYELLTRLCPAAAAPAPALTPTPGGAAAGLDLELLQRPCAWAHDAAGYESRLYSVLRPTPPASLCGEERRPAAFARVMQSVEVLH